MLDFLTESFRFFKQFEISAKNLIKRYANLRNFRNRNEMTCQHQLAVNNACLRIHLFAIRKEIAKSFVNEISTPQSPTQKNEFNLTLTLSAFFAVKTFQTFDKRKNFRII